MFLSTIYFGLPPCPETVTTRIIIFLVGDPYEPSFATVTGRGDNPIYTAYFPLQMGGGQMIFFHYVALGQCLNTGNSNGR